MQQRQRTDYSVSSFPGGEALLESGSGFDVTFLDIRSSRDGMQTARLLRRQGLAGKKRRR